MINVVEGILEGIGGTKNRWDITLIKKGFFWFNFGFFLYEKKPFSQAYLLAYKVAF